MSDTPVQPDVALLERIMASLPSDATKDTPLQSDIRTAVMWTAVLAEAQAGQMP